jgi:hypothetical protein
VTGLGKIGAFTQNEAPGSLIGNFGVVAVGPNGAVVANWQNDDTKRPDVSNVYVTIDTDGLGLKPLSVERIVTQTYVGGFYSIPAQPTRTIDAEANLAFDRGTSRWSGRLYMTYTDAAKADSDNTDIFVRWSDDQGFTWSKRVRISDDKSDNSQILPSLSVDDATGRIAVFWHDARTDDDNVLTEPWVSMSNDGGATWTPNVRVHTGQSTHRNGAPPPGFNDIDYGDYTGVSLYKGALFPVWADNSKVLGGNPKLPKFDLATKRILVAEVEDAPITGSKKTLVAQRFRNLSTVVASFRDANPNGELSEFSATIDWGDGSTSTGKISVTSGVYKVTGTHRYTTVQPKLTAVITIKSIGGSQAVVNSPVTIIDPTPSPLIAVGADAPNSADVKLINPVGGGTMGEFRAYGTTFTGGVRVAVGDVSNDGFDDIITAPGPGEGAKGEVRIFDGVRFTLFTPTRGIITPFGADYTGGMYVAVGDVNGDLAPDIIVSADAGASRPVRIYNAVDLKLINEFNVYDTKFQGGVRVAAGDLDFDGVAELITAPGPGAAKPVRVWNPNTAALIKEFFPFGNTYKGGVFVASGKADDNLRPDIAVSTNDGSRFRSFSGEDFGKIDDFDVFGPSLTAGTRIAMFDYNNDGFDEVIAAPGPGKALPLRIADTFAHDTLLDIFPFGESYKGGMFVAASIPFTIV